MKWPTSKLKFVARFAYGDALPSDEIQDGPFRVFGSNGPFAAFSRANTKAPAIVVGRKGSYGKVNWTSEPCFASDTTFFVDGSTTRHNLRWIYWLLQALRLDEGTDEAAVPGLNRESAHDKDVPVPTAGQQHTIADYLDRETARLDALVAAKQRVLGLLAEKRRALITRAVTRGLDPRARLRDSGIPWLGEIPVHWQVKRLKHISPYITVGVVVNPSSYVTADGVPFLYGSDVTEEGISLDSVRRVKPEVSRGELAKTCLKAGDIVTVRVGAPGITAVVPPDLEGANCASIMLTRAAASFDSHWLAYTMNSSVGRYQVALAQYGAAQEQFNIGHAVDFLFAVPPLSDQQKIVSQIRSDTAALDDVRSTTSHSIELLKERRNALIAAAVMGTIDVRKPIA